MADPLSIAASVLAVVGTAEKVTKELTRLIGADDAILATLNELTDLKLVLLSINDFVDAVKVAPIQSAPIADRITHTLKTAQRKVDELHGLLHGKVLGKRYANPSARKAIRIVAWARERSKILRLKDDIRHLSRNLGYHLSAFTSISSLQLHINIGEAASASHNLMPKRRVEPKISGNDLSERLNLHESVQHQSSALSIFSHSSDDPMRRTRTPPIDSFGAREIECARTSRLNPYESVLVHRSVCDRACVCACHGSSTVKSPDSLSRILGSLFIGYAGVVSPLNPTKCSRKGCKKRSELSVKYYFPRWFVSGMVSLALSSLMNGRVDISLAFNPVLAWNSNVFLFAESNLEGLSDIIKKDPWLVKGVDCFFGWNLLRFVLERFVFDGPEDPNDLQKPTIRATQRIELAHWLIQAGCDPLLENKYGSTTIDWAWFRLLTIPGYESNKSLFLSVFGHYENDFLERQQFGRFHNIVLGYSKVDLQAELMHSKDDVDCADAFGRTALSWASARNDVEAIQLLLEAGADIDHCSATFGSPLHFAVGLGASDAVDILIKNGARINVRNSFGLNPFEIIPFHRDLRHSTRVFNGDTYRVILDRLLSAGLAAASGVNGACTPLLAAVWLELGIQIIERLIMDGADPNTSHLDGHIALHRAAESRDVSIVNCLLRVGSDVNSRNKIGETPLHHGATNINPEAIKVIRSLIRHGADVNARDCNGETPLLQACKSHREPNQHPIVVCLLDNAADVESENCEGITPLLRATGSANAIIVRELLSRGARPSVTDGAGQTVLHEAAKTANDEVIRVLLDAAKRNPVPFHSLDIRRRDKQGMTALEVFQMHHATSPQISSCDLQDHGPALPSNHLVEVERARNSLQQFTELLALIDRLRDCPPSGSPLPSQYELIDPGSAGDDSDDDFYDALEASINATQDDPDLDCSTCSTSESVSQQEQ